MSGVEIRIFDVAHGFCAFAVADSGEMILVDCGHNDQTGFRPSNYLPANGFTAIDRLFISNYDEDHLSDLPNLQHRVTIRSLYRNRSIGPDDLYRLKLQAGPLQSGMEELLGMIRTYTGPVSQPTVELALFCNEYPTF